MARQFLKKKYVRLELHNSIVVLIHGSIDLSTGFEDLHCQFNSSDEIANWKKPRAEGGRGQHTEFCESVGRGAKVGKIRDISPRKLGEGVFRRLLNIVVV